MDVAYTYTNIIITNSFVLNSQKFRIFDIILE